MIDYKKIKHYVVSSLITFMTGFLTMLIPSLDKLDLQNIEMSILTGIFLVALRAGIKAVLEKYLEKLVKM